MESEIQPLVSAIITTYNRDVLIVKRALDSIINQTYNNIEIIIVNDCPNNAKNHNDIINLIKKYNKKVIKYILVKENGGACKARNIGIDNSKGEYIAFLDDDDEWYSNKIEEMVNLAVSSKAAIIYSNAKIHNENSNIEITRFKKIPPQGYIYYELFINNYIGSCSFPLIKKNSLTEVDGFNEKMPALQDWELYLRIAKNNNVYYVDKELTKYYVYNGERISKNSSKRAKAFQMLFDNYYDEVRTNKKANYYFLMNGVKIYANNRQLKNAYSLWFKAIFLKPFNIIYNFKLFTFILIRLFYDKSNNI